MQIEFLFGESITNLPIVLKIYHDVTLLDYFFYFCLRRTTTLSLPISIQFSQNIAKYNFVGTTFATCQSNVCAKYYKKHGKVKTLTSDLIVINSKLGKYDSQASEMLGMSKIIGLRMIMTLANAAVLHGAITSQVVCLTSNSKWGVGTWLGGNLH